MGAELHFSQLFAARPTLDALALSLSLAGALAGALKNVSRIDLQAIREQSSLSAAPAVVPPLRHLAPVNGKMARVWRLWMGVVAYRGRPAAVLA